VLGGDDDPRDHHEERHHLAGDGAGAVADGYVQPGDAERDGDNRVGRGDDRLDRRQERALLEGVLVEQEAERADDEEHIDRPVAEHPLGPAGEFRGNELDGEGGDPVAQAAGQRRRERAQALAPGPHHQAGRHQHGKPDRERRQRAEGGMVLAGRRTSDGEESGHADRGGGDPREHRLVRAPAARALDVGTLSQVPRDHHGGHQVADEDRLHQRQAPVIERHHLQRESDDIAPDGGQPERLPGQVDEDLGRQRFPGLDLLGAALVRDRRYP
jgi:hypothetical protein